MENNATLQYLTLNLQVSLSFFLFLYQHAQLHNYPEANKHKALNYVLLAF